MISHYLYYYCVYVYGLADTACNIRYSSSAENARGSYIIMIWIYSSYFAGAYLERFGFIFHPSIKFQIRDVPIPT